MDGGGGGGNRTPRIRVSKAAQPFLVSNSNFKLTKEHSLSLSSTTSLSIFSHLERLRREREREREVWVIQRYILNEQRGIK